MDDLNMCCMDGLRVIPACLSLQRCGAMAGCLSFTMHQPGKYIFPAVLTLLTRYQLAKQTIITTFDAITELLLFVISIYLVWKLQINITAKVLVVSAFGFRLP